MLHPPKNIECFTLTSVLPFVIAEEIYSKTLLRFAKLSPSFVYSTEQRETINLCLRYRWLVPLKYPFDSYNIIYRRYYLQLHNKKTSIIYLQITKKSRLCAISIARECSAKVTRNKNKVDSYLLLNNKRHTERNPTLNFTTRRGMHTLRILPMCVCLCLCVTRSAQNCASGGWVGGIDSAHQKPPSAQPSHPFPAANACFFAPAKLLA